MERRFEVQRPVVAPPPPRAPAWLRALRAALAAAPERDAARRFVRRPPP